ncbi:MAG: hypothetical protein J7474_10595, partial [Arthrobacter sp.]|nr:hypothetical protein [Arthrobacter sp.]
MSTTGTTGVPAAIADYAAAVRRELGDLPKHDVDELTEGLDADLLEQFRESGTAPLESPQSYAEELRTAAGFAPAAASDTSSGGFRAWWQRTKTRLVQTLGSWPMARPVWRFLVQLRPVWWVLRAWIVYRVIMILWGSGESYYFLPRDVLAWALLIVLTVLSVRLSLKTLPSEHWPARIRTILNVVTALIAVAVVPTAISVINRPPGHEIYGPETGGPCTLFDGICHNGSVVGPFFVYGPDGTRLENVRFFTSDGSSIPIDLA